MMNKVGGVKRIAVSFIFFVMLIPFILNFIPIKCAIGLDAAQQNLGNGRYICVTDYKSKIVFQTKWFAEIETNSHLDRSFVVNVLGNSPN